jgi:hypothetical protein
MHRRDLRPAGQPIPGVTKLGAATMAFGLVFDASEHSFTPATTGGFPPGEHLAHLVVLVGMVLGLAGIVADGVRNSGREARRAGRNDRHAVR